MSSSDVVLFFGSRPRSVAMGVLFALAVLTSALALGALHTPVLCIAAALLAVAGFVSWFPGTPLQTRFPATVLLATGVALTAFTAFQAVPLPLSVVRLLSPNAAEVWDNALSPLHERGPSWATLSLDPIATRLQVLRGVTYTTAFLVALRIAERRRGSRFLSIVIIATSLILAASAVLHPILGAERVFGIYKPGRGILPRHIAPLLNANHLAAYLNIGFCLALGIVFNRRPDPYRPIAVSVAVLLATTQIWVASRGGIIALGFGATCVLLMTRISRRFTLAGAGIVLPLAAVGAGLLMIVLGAIPEAADEAVSGDVSKLRVALSALPLVLRYPLFGVGRGAFAQAFPSIRHDEAGYVTFSHPENLPIQWLTEWGIPATLLAFLALTFAMRPRVLVVSSSPAIGAWAAIATTVVHNLVDYNSEVPAIGIVVAACAAMLVAGRGSVSKGFLHRWASAPRVIGGAIGVTTIATVALALQGWPHEASNDQESLYAAVAQSAALDFASEERQALLHHPAEPYIPFVGAITASRRSQSVLPWIERTLTLAPLYAPAHLLLAQHLERRSPSQARLEYRLALTQDPLLLAQALPRLAPLVRSFDDALELAPTNRGRAGVLELVAASVGERLPATRQRLDAAVRSLSPTATGPLHRILEDFDADVLAGDAAPWCLERRSCLQAGMDAVEKLIILQPGHCEPFVARAKLELAAGDPEGALHGLQLEAPRAINPLECWRGLGELALSIRNDIYVAAAEEQGTRSGCTSESDCVSTLVWAASVEERRGNYRSTLAYYERAQTKAPERLDLVERVAQLASRLGLHAEAANAYNTLARGKGDSLRWQQLADQERLQLSQEVPIEHR